MMNKRILILILFCIVFSVNSICLAYPNEKNGFRDFYWGESLQEVQANDDIYDLEYNSYNEKSNTVEYVAKLKKHYIEDFEVNEIIFFEFWNNKLYKVNVIFPVKKDFLKKIMKILEKDYGIENMTINGLSYIGEGEKTRITVSFGNKIGSIDFISLYLEKELAKNEFIKDW